MVAVGMLAGGAVVAAVQFGVVLLLTSLWVEQSYIRIGITDGGGGFGDAHAFHLALIWTGVLVGLELGATVLAWRAFRQHRLEPETDDR